MTSKWLITMAGIVPLPGATFPFQMAFPWPRKVGDPSYILSGVMIQVPSLKLFRTHEPVMNVDLFLFYMPHFLLSP